MNTKLIICATLAILGLTSLFPEINCLHLIPPEETNQAVSWRNTPLDSSNMPLGENLNFRLNSNLSSSEGSSVKGNLNSILPNPATLTTQLQTTIQNLIKALNNTLSTLNSNSTSFTNIIGSVKNLTSSVINKPRLEDMEAFSANISEILKFSNEKSLADSTLPNNSTSVLSDEAEGALREFQETVKEFGSSAVPGHSASEAVLEKRTGESPTVPATNNGKTNQVQQFSEPFRSNLHNGSKRTKGKEGFQRIMKKVSEFQSSVDSKMQKSILEARSRIEDTARQGSQFMRNQTTGFMNEIRRAFLSFSEPIRKFFDDVRSRPLTTVITA